MIIRRWAHGGHFVFRGMYGDSTKSYHSSLFFMGIEVLYDLGRGVKVPNQGGGGIGYLIRVRWDRSNDDLTGGSQRPCCI